MHSNGVPDYPYPVGEKGNFNGIDLGPHVNGASKLCGNKLNFPAWWVNGWGPPGDVSVESQGIENGLLGPGGGGEGNG